MAYNVYKMNPLKSPTHLQSTGRDTSQQQQDLSLPYLGNNKITLSVVKSI